MMKKTTTKRTGTAGAGKTALALAFLLAAAGTVSAEDGLAVTGDTRTGLVIEKNGDNDAVAYLGNNEGEPGRVELVFTYTKGNFMVKWYTDFTGAADTGDALNAGKYSLVTANDLFGGAYGAASFLDEQLRLSVGKISDAVWGNSGTIDDSLDAVSGARLQYLPGAVPGLQLGFFLPVVYSSTGNYVEVADYFSEMGFGGRYLSPGEAVDIRLAYRNDGPNDGAWDSSWSADNSGGKLLYGAGLKLDSLLPGFTLWYSGRLSGLKTNDQVPDSSLNTVNWLDIHYYPEGWGVYVDFGFETWAEGGSAFTGGGGGKATGFYVEAGGEWQVTPWVKPWLYNKLSTYSYESGSKVAGNTPAALDTILFEPGADLSLGNGLTIVPMLDLTVKFADGPSAAKDETVVDAKFTVKLTYAF